jgi:hypothetical protein
VKVSVAGHALDRGDEEVGRQHSIIEPRSGGAQNWRFRCAFSTRRGMHALRARLVRRNRLQMRSIAILASRGRPAMWPVVFPAGIPGFGRLRTAISGAG